MNIQGKCYKSISATMLHSERQIQIRQPKLSFPVIHKNGNTAIFVLPT